MRFFVVSRTFPLVLSLLLLCAYLNGVFRNYLLFFRCLFHRDADERRVVAGHEAAHLALHMDELLKGPARMLKDFNLWDDSGRIERQANLFTADFMLDDEEVMDAVQSEDEDRDFFSIAREFYVPPPLLAFKQYSMMRHGYDVRVPIDVDSKFLGK